MERPRPTQEPKPKVDLQAKLNNQRAFVNAVIEDGVHLRTPQGISEAEWKRQKEIVARIVGTDFTGADLGEMFGIERERVRQIFNEGVRNLWRSSNAETQEQFPLERLFGIRKPVTLRLAEKISTSQGGYLTEIRKLAEAGVRSPKKIAEALKIPKRIARDSARKLSRRGIVFDRDSFSLREIEKAILLAADDDTKLREILYSISDRTARYMLQGKGKDIVSLSNMIRELGFHPAAIDLYFFSAILEDNDIPVREILNGFFHGRNGRISRRRNIVVLEKHRQKINKAFENEPDLQKFKKNPVILVCGVWKGELPTTTIVHKKREYFLLSNLIAELIEKPVYRTHKYLRSFKDCPVPVFKAEGRYLYPKKREDELEEFLRGRLKA